MSARSDTGPFVLIPLWVLEAVPPRAVLVYAQLASFADYDTGEAWPSRATLADRCGCSVDTIDRAVAELVAAGAIEVEPNSDERGQSANSYRVIRAEPVSTGAAEARSVRRGGRKDAAGGGRKNAARNENHRNESTTTAIAVVGDPAAPSAADVVAEYVDTYRSLSGGIDPPRRTIGHLAREAKALVVEGYPVENVTAAARQLACKGLNPGTLASVLAEQLTAGNRPRRGGGLTPEQVVARGRGEAA